MYKFWVTSSDPISLANFATEGLGGDKKKGEFHGLYVSKIMI